MARRESKIRAALLCFATAIFLAVSLPAQNSSLAANASVKTDVLPVYPELRASGEAVETLKMGDAVYVDYQFALLGTAWCGVRRPGQASRLGYVNCSGLNREPAPKNSSGDSSNSAPYSLRPNGSSKTTVPLRSPPLELAVGCRAIKAQVVREGVVDTVLILRFESEAQSGSAGAMSRASLAHLAAGEFDLSEDNLDSALDEFSAAQRFAARQHDALFVSLLGQTYVHLRRSEFSEALETSLHARRISPQSSVAAAFSGLARYRLNQIDAAIEDWQSAQRSKPDPQVAVLLGQALREKSAEGDYREGETSHFQLRYHGGASPQLAAAILHVLETQYRDLQADLRFTTPEPIAVILYTQEAFREVLEAPDWAGAGNDGRIRIPVQGIDSVSERLAQVLKHELTHSFVRQKTRGLCPTWLNEGIALYMEGRRSNRSAGPLLAAYQGGQGLPLANFDGPWTRFTPVQAQYAYAWSLAVVETIVANSGLEVLDRLLDMAVTQPSGEAMIRAGLHMNYADLEGATERYLRETYAP